MLISSTTDTTNLCGSAQIQPMSMAVVNTSPNTPITPLLQVTHSLNTSKDIQTLSTYYNCSSYPMDSQQYHKQTQI